MQPAGEALARRPMSCIGAVDPIDAGRRDAREPRRQMRDVINDRPLAGARALGLEGDRHAANNAAFCGFPQSWIKNAGAP